MATKLDLVSILGRIALVLFFPFFTASILALFLYFRFRDEIPPDFGDALEVLKDYWAAILGRPSLL